MWPLLLDPVQPEPDPEPQEEAAQRVSVMWGRRGGQVTALKEALREMEAMSLEPAPEPIPEEIRLRRWEDDPSWQAAPPIQPGFRGYVQEERRLPPFLAEHPGSRQQRLRKQRRRGGR